MKKVVEEGIDPQKDAFQQHLALKLSKSGVSYTLFNLESNTYFKVVSYTDKLVTTTDKLKFYKEVFKLDGTLQQQYKTISIALGTEKSSLVPASLYKQEKAEELLDFNHIHEIEGNCKADFLKNLNAYNVYELLPELESIIKKQFPGAVVLNNNTVAVESSLIQEKNSTNCAAYLFIEEDDFYLIVINKGKLVFNNLFNYHSEEDIAYYTLFCCNELKLKLKDLRVEINGMHDGVDGITSILKKYVGNVSLVDLSSELNFVNDISKSTKNQFAELFLQYKCV